MVIMAGFATARTIRKLEQETGLTETPFSAVTAYHSEESKYACINSGMATYIPKPVVIRQHRSRYDQINTYSFLIPGRLIAEDPYCQSVLLRLETVQRGICAGKETGAVYETRTHGYVRGVR